MAARHIPHLSPSRSAQTVLLLGSSTCDGTQHKLYENTPIHVLSTLHRFLFNVIYLNYSSTSLVSVPADLRALDHAAAVDVDILQRGAAVHALLQARRRAPGHHLRLTPQPFTRLHSLFGLVRPGLLRSFPPEYRFFVTT